MKHFLIALTVTLSTLPGHKYAKQAAILTKQTGCPTKVVVVRGRATFMPFCQLKVKK